MKLFVLTIFALISIGLASPVKNLDSDVLIELFNNEIDQESFLVSANKEVDEESKQLASFFQKSLPKLEKIRVGLKKDGYTKAGLIVENAIELYKPFVDENVVAKQKIRAKFYVIAAMAIMNLNKKYLKEKNSEETLFDGLNFIESEDNEDVDEESEKLAQFFTESLPKLEKIRDGLKKDGYEKASMLVAKAIEQYRPYTSAEYVAANKDQAQLNGFVTLVIIHFHQRYLKE